MTASSFTYSYLLISEGMLAVLRTKKLNQVIAGKMPPAK